MNVKSAYFLVFFLATLPINGCPFIITNDGQEMVFIVDPHGKNAIFLEPGKTETINPERTGIWKYLANEQLDIYVPYNKSKQFYQRYQIGKHVCKEEGNKLNFSDIERFAQEPHNPFSIKAFNGKSKQ